MVVPFHHCDAIGCHELITPGELMCSQHWPLVKDETVRQLAAASTPSEHFLAELLARGDVLLATTPVPDASQASSTKSSVSGDAESHKETNS